MFFLPGRSGKPARPQGAAAQGTELRSRAVLGKFLTFPCKLALLIQQVFAERFPHGPRTILDAKDTKQTKSVPTELTF